MNIETKKLKSNIDNNNILKGIDIKVDNKEFVGIIGPNGSGKSTLLKCIYRNLKPSSGVVMLDKKDISSMSMKESAKKLAVLSQHNHYDFDFKVSDIVLMGRSPHKKMMERDSKKDFEIVNDVLKKVGMLEFKERSFNTLSGGEQQRIILARALAQQTDCLILDEPTNHLDIKYQLQLMNIVKDLNIEIVAAIHDLNIALMYCDKIYVLKEGKIVAYGTADEVLTRNLIKEVYEVDAILNKDENGKLLSISYIPYLNASENINI